MTNDDMTCSICGGRAECVHDAVEMFFGKRDRFHYRECSQCGCLQLMDPPADLSAYYPKNYYSFHEPLPPLPKSPLRRWIAQKRSSGQLLGTPFHWHGISRLRPRRELKEPARWLKHAKGISLHSAILDIGCGKGDLLHKLANAGFTNLWGVDPYLDQSQEFPPSLRILACEVSDLSATSFDLVMLHHSLEHIPDQKQVFREIKRLLSPGGTCLIRVPVADSEPWEKYRVHWVELDPPRHFHLHTRRSLEILAEAHQLDITAVEYDSTSFAYWASELYLQEKSLVDPDTQTERNPADNFSPEQIAEFERLAAEANRRGRGGRAAFYLRHSAG